MKKMLLKIFSVVMCTQLVMAAFSTAHASDIKVIVNGAELAVGDAAPIIENGRTLVPLRAIFEQLGCQVAWEAETKTVVAIGRGTSVCLQIGQSQLFKNSEIIEIDVPAQIVNDRTMVPVRAISEALDCEVNWDETTKTVTVNG